MTRTDIKTIVRVLKLNLGEWQSIAAVTAATAFSKTTVNDVQFCALASGTGVGRLLPQQRRRRRGTGFLVRGKRQEDRNVMKHRPGPVIPADHCQD